MKKNLSAILIISLGLILVLALYVKRESRSLDECQSLLGSSGISGSLINECMDVAKKSSDRGNPLGSRVSGLYFMLAKFDVFSAEKQFEKAVFLGNNDSRIDLIAIYHNRKPGKYCDKAKNLLNGYVVHNGDQRSLRDSWEKTLKRSGCDMD